MQVNRKSNTKIQHFPYVKDGPGKVQRTIEAIRCLFRIRPWTTEEIATTFLFDEFARVDELPELYQEIESYLWECGFIQTNRDGFDAPTHWVEKIGEDDGNLSKNDGSEKVTPPLFIRAKPARISKNDHPSVTVNPNHAAQAVGKVRT